MPPLLDANDPDSLDIVCDVILADWFNAGIDTFDIRDFREELELHYRDAGKPVPPEVADPARLVPALRLLQARMHLVKPTRITGIEWQFVRDGGLMSYGADPKESFERAGDFVSQIFKGKRPADIPFEQPTRYPFVINLKTAKAIGLEMPPNLVALKFREEEGSYLVGALADNADLHHHPFVHDELPGQHAIERRIQFGQTWIIRLILMQRPVNRVPLVGQRHPPIIPERQFRQQFFDVCRQPVIVG